MSLRRNRLSFHGLNVEVECLESRTVPSASMAGHFATVSPLSHGSDHATGVSASETRLVGKLVSNDPAVNATGSVSFESETHGSKTSTEFQAKVKGLAANTSYDVAIDGVVVGTIKTNAAGSGQLELKSGDRSHPLPANFPTVSANSVVTVGSNLSTTLGPPAKPVEHATEDHAETNLRASISDPTGATKLKGQAEFETESEHGTIISDLKVTVSNATPGATLDVKIDDISIGSTVVDASGKGSLVLSSQAVAGSSMAFPPDFPALHTGSTIKVGDAAIGTFAMSH